MSTGMTAGDLIINHPYVCLLVRSGAHDLPTIPVSANDFVRSRRDVLGGHEPLPREGVQGVSFANRGGRFVEKVAHESPGQDRSAGQVGRERHLFGKKQMGAELVRYGPTNKKHK